MSVLVIYCQGEQEPTLAERQAVQELAHVPGVALVNYLAVDRARTREIDLVLLTASGLSALEVKGTGLSGDVHTPVTGDWTIGETAADFHGGTNPLPQARKAAQILRSTLKRAEVRSPFIPAIVALAGDGLHLAPTRLGDAWATTVEHLPALLLRMRRTPVSLADANAILEALGVPVDAHALTGEGFGEDHAADCDTSDGPGGRSGRSTSRDRRRARRYGELVEQASAAWAQSNRRRLAGSTFGLLVSLAFMASATWREVTVGVLFAALFGALQLGVRARKSGRRTSGPGAVASWLLSISPAAGIGTCLSAISHISAAPIASEGTLVRLQVSALLIVALAATMLTGKSSYIHPPQVVLERFDASGRPTGAFMLADAVPRNRQQHDWRDPEEDETTTPLDTASA